MKYLNFKSEYNTKPVHNIKSDGQLFNSVKKIISELNRLGSGTLAFETYPGVDLDVLKKDVITPLGATLVINIEDYAKSSAEIQSMLQHNLTDDRVFGIYSHHTIHDFYPVENLLEVKNLIKDHKGLVIVYGFGAHLVGYDHLVHVSLTRWEIQLRYRRGLSNFKTNNGTEDVLRKYKRGFFVEWRVADRIKDEIKDSLDYVIDYNDTKKPVMITSKDYHDALLSLTQRPFRLTPYFDPGVWGGQWMKEVCNLPENNTNYAWSFDGVPEENSVALQFGQDIINLPAQDIVQFYPRQLMGNKVHGRFGKMFPIRFDLLDTMQGGNLSLQVHPLTEYIFDKFGMTYTQDESYYILDAKNDGVVYLGFKENVDKNTFEKALKDAEKGIKPLDADQYVNKYVVKKHDHISIPAGTIHCSATDTMVLEISACNYIFTFKLWDWDRLGLDGQPRPVHLNHGLVNLDYKRDTKWVEKELINPFVKINDHEEITGLHERQFLQTKRFKFDAPYEVENDQTVMMANLVEGRGAMISSPTNAFEPYEVHYAETFIIPADVDRFIFTPKYKDELCMIISAKVKQ